MLIEGEPDEKLQLYEFAPITDGVKVMGKFTLLPDDENAEEVESNVIPIELLMLFPQVFDAETEIFPEIFPKLTVIIVSELLVITAPVGTTQL